MNVDTQRICAQQTQSRNELHNIRKSIQALKAQHIKDVTRIAQLINKDKSQKLSNEGEPKKGSENSISEDLVVTWKPIGYIRSLFHSKNGTPRQGSVTPLSRGILKLSKDIFTNPQHSLEGIQEFSYVWLFFIFDRNGPPDKSANNNFMKAKVAPPRLNGQKVGVFASRSPHRPNPLGLTLARLDRLEGDCLHLSGLDILDGTPIVDIKPYIPEYDRPPETSKDVKCEGTDGGLHKNNESVEVESFLIDNTLELSNNDISYSACKQIKCKRKFKDKTEGSEKYDLNIENELNSKARGKEFIDKESHKSTNEKLAGDHDINDVKIAPWLSEPPVSQLEVVINPRAEKQIVLFSSDTHDQHYRLKYLKNSEELSEAICSVLREDPRSIYRRQKCSSQLYFFTVDTAHITVWFDQNIAEVLKVKPVIEQD